MDFNRRVFLKSLGMGTAACLLSSGGLPRLARGQAAGEVGRNFIFCYFSGGWDTLLGLDPRDPGVFTEDRVGQTRIQLAWDRLPVGFSQTIIQPRGSNIGFGPAAESFARHFDKSCVVRGVSMDTLTHEVGRRYFITGLAPRGLSAAGSSMGTRIVAQQGDLSPIPHLVARVESYNEGDPAFASGMSVNSVTDLITALADGPQAPAGAVRARLDEYRQRRQGCDPAASNARGFLTLIEETQFKARELVVGGFNRRFQFTNANDPEMVALSARYGITNLAGAESQAAMAFQALKYGIAQSVTIELASGLDTHDNTWETDQAPNQAIGFSALATLVDDLAAEPHPEGGVLLDHTTIVCFSEFGRTPTLNSRDGRDHSLSSSALMIGAGVPHNKVVGATSDVAMNPRAVDPSTGEPVESGGVTLSPTLVLASAMASAGLNTDALRVDGLPCLMA